MKLNNLAWIQSYLPDDIISKNMLGGIGYYYDDKLILIIIETVSSYEYKNISYPFQIWNGCIFSIEPIKQDAVFAKFSFLENHPAYKKGLYLPADTEYFDQNVKDLLKEIKKKNPLFGVPIKLKNKNQFENDEVDTSRPRLFGDVPKIKKTIITESKRINKSQDKKPKSNKKNENNFILNLLKK